MQFSVIFSMLFCMKVIDDIAVAFWKHFKVALFKVKVSKSVPLGAL